MHAVSLVPKVKRRAAVCLPVTGDVSADLKTRSALVTAARAAGIDVVMLIEVTGDVKAARSQVVLAASNGTVDTVVVNALVNLGLDLFDAVSAAMELLTVGTKILSVQEPWLHTSDPTSAFTWFLVEETKRKARVIKAGQERARARAPNVKVGRPKKPVGTEQLEHALALIASGVSIGRAAARIGCSRSHLKRALAAHEALNLPTAATGSPLAQRLTRYAETVCKEVG